MKKPSDLLSADSPLKKDRRVQTAGHNNALSDLTFITNEDHQSLLNRFQVLIQDTEVFSVLVGYFYSSGFYALYPSLEKTKKIRILIGIGTNKETAQLISWSGWPLDQSIGQSFPVSGLPLRGEEPLKRHPLKNQQYEVSFSYAETKQHFSSALIQEMEHSSDSRQVYEGVIKFMEWLRSGKLEIKAYPSANIHAKLYIMSFKEGDRDRGRVITGSSNFTKAGLVDNLEFNVELKNRADYEFALQKFNQLWEEAVDLKDKYLETIQQKTWLNDTITPYELYLKFLYAYFKEEIGSLGSPSLKYTPPGFKQLEYQSQAVQNAKRILLAYGGVFLSDVVGLGKTYMSAMLAGELSGRSLVLAPPLLLEESNPGSWKNVFSDFRIPADFESLGKLDKLIERGVEKYKNVFIDEAHRFRRETNITYEKLAQITRGKRVILVTATPFNNTPSDILSQIKLFQKAKNSTIPNIPNLEKFFGDLDRKIQKTKKHLTKAQDFDPDLSSSGLKPTARKPTGDHKAVSFEKGTTFETVSSYKVHKKQENANKTSINQTARKPVSFEKGATFEDLSSYKVDVQHENANKPNISIEKQSTMYKAYIQAIKQSSKKIREHVLKYLMVRRTRTEIEKYFAEDINQQGVHFPEVQDPQPLYYQFNQKENEIFQKTVDLIGKNLKYARYCPLTYYKYPDRLSQLELQSQKNLGIFMKILLVKRLESSFHAFRSSLERFISSYELFLKEFKAGNVYVSKAYANKIFDFLSDDNELAIEKLLSEGKAKRYSAQDFDKNLKTDLENDLQVLRAIQSLWEGIDRDPKLLTLMKELSQSSQDLAQNSDQKAVRGSLSSPDTGPTRRQDALQGLAQSSEQRTERHPLSSPDTGATRRSFPRTRESSQKNNFSVLKENKLIIFTESKETAEYLGEALSQKMPDKVLVFTGSSKGAVRDDIIANFDAKAFKPKEDYRILVTTDVLSEGVNLHRSNVVINYDIPWNPTRLMQRVGRVNRVDTSFNEIYTFNFFPTVESNDVIKLEETAKAKISAFINLLGADARLLTEEEEVTSHELFGQLSSKKTLIGEEEEAESELKYLKIIRGIRDQDPDLFNRIKLLPKKARTARALVDTAMGTSPRLGTESRAEKEVGKLLTYFRKGQLQKFFLVGAQESAIELDFTTSARLLECEKGVERKPLPKDFFDLLHKNKEAFLSLTSEEKQLTVSTRSGADRETKLLKILKAIQRDLRQFTEEQEVFFKQVVQRLEEGALPKQTIKTTLKALQNQLIFLKGSTKGLGSDSKEKMKHENANKTSINLLTVLQKNIPDRLLESHVSENSDVKKNPSEVILSEYLKPNGL